MFEHNVLDTHCGEVQVSSVYIFTGVSVFLFSCRRGHLDVARCIVQQEPTLTEMKDHLGDTPLHLACRWAPPPSAICFSCNHSAGKVSFYIALATVYWKIHSIPDSMQFSFHNRRCKVPYSGTFSRVKIFMYWSLLGIMCLCMPTRTLNVKARTQIINIAALDLSLQLPSASRVLQVLTMSDGSWCGLAANCGLKFGGFI